MLLLEDLKNFFDTLHPIGVSLFVLLIGPWLYCQFGARKHGRNRAQIDKTLREIKERAAHGVASQFEGREISDVLDEILKESPLILSEPSISKWPMGLVVGEMCVILAVTLINPWASADNIFSDIQSILWVIFIFIAPVLMISLNSLVSYLGEMDRLNAKFPDLKNKALIKVE